MGKLPAAWIRVANFLHEQISEAIRTAGRNPHFGLSAGGSDQLSSTDAFSARATFLSIAFLAGPYSSSSACARVFLAHAKMRSCRVEVLRHEGILRND